MKTEGRQGKVAADTEVMCPQAEEQRTAHHYWKRAERQGKIPSQGPRKEPTATSCGLPAC